MSNNGIHNNLESVLNNEYNPAEVETTWREQWERDGIYNSDVDPDRPKFYFLTMLPYPSGNLHIGHWFVMTNSDARARYLRMQGYNVMFPIGFDAFGLPAENAAIQRNIHPKEWTYSNIDNMRRQLRSMGAMFDWRREAVSCDPKYYKWTQWFFLKLFEKGLAYRKKAFVDWCPTDNTTLAREQVVGDERVCERCGTPVVKKELTQWYFRITDYADELLRFDLVDWPNSIMARQTNWIGRSEGASVIFKTEAGDDIEVFTTRPDTLWGATFMVLAPEHPLVDSLTTDENKQAVEAYKFEAGRQSAIERQSTDKEKTGVFTGGYAINPVNNEKIQVWIADYVMMEYGTGAIMAVPGHDQRDFEFARKFDLPVQVVIRPERETWEGADLTEAWPHEGLMVNSGQFDGTPATEEKGRKNTAINAVIDYLEQAGIGKEDINYRLHDWTISRQRYWGAPIPMVYCESCGVVPVPEDQLPIELPDDIEWRPTGESPLTFHPTWKHTTCPSCDEPAIRDTDTMDTFMCSSWYHLRYLSPDYDEGPFDPQEYDYWMPVDSYTGGSEHAVMHLLYTRFFHKTLRDMGVAEGHEPMMQLRNQGHILGPDGNRMSKSKGNVVDPDEQIAKYGADTVRAYLMFGYRFSEGGPWSDDNIQGVVRWMRRVWAMFTEPYHTDVAASDEAIAALRRKVHQTLDKIGQDYEKFEFNTVISSLMELMNEMYRLRDEGAYGTPAWDEALDYYLRMMAPCTPHIAEELWTRLGKGYSIHQQPWPVVDEDAAAEDEIELVVQINGKVRDKILVAAGINDEDAKTTALASETVQKFMEGKQPRKVIVVQGRLVNIVL